MWHLKTRVGTFWIVEGQLGLEDSTLGRYKTSEEAVTAVSTQHTGDLKWDSQTDVCVPGRISSWSQGEPQDWRES